MSNKLTPCVDWQAAWKHAKEDKTVRVTYTVSSTTKSPFRINVIDKLGLIDRIHGAFYNGHSFSAMFALDRALKEKDAPPTEVSFVVENIDKMEEAKEFDIDLHMIMVELIDV